MSSIYSDKLPQHLHQKGLQSIYVLHGNEALLMQEAADSIRTLARSKGFTERISHTVSGAHFDWSEVWGAVQSRSLFAQQQVVEIHIPNGKPGKDGNAALQHIAQSSADHNSLLLIITLPRLDKASRNTAWFTALEQAGVSVQIDSIDRAALPRWIAQRLHHHGLHVASDSAGEQALRQFADRVEGNLLAAHQEVEKLALLYPPGELSAEHIQSAVGNVARYDVFKLSDAIFNADLLRVQRMLDGLCAEGESPVLVHYTLAEDIRTLRRVQQALHEGKPWPLIAREQRLWGGRERLFERTAPYAQPRVLARLLHDAHIVDGIVKGIPAPDWPTEPWQALHRLAIALCRDVCLPALHTSTPRINRSQTRPRYG